MAGELSALHFRSLRATLASLPASAGDPALAHHLRLQLERSRPAFRRLLDKPAPNQKEKDELEKSSQFTPLGSTSSQIINQEFRLEALFLASQLAISERLAASLLSSALNDSHHRPGRPHAENAVVLFYEERRDLLISLQLLFSYLTNIEILQALDPSARNVLTSFANELVSHEEPKDGSWIKKCLKDIDSQSKAVEEIRNAGLNPTNQPATSLGIGSSTSNQQGAKARFNDGINNLRINAHSEERRLLATVVYLAASARLLSKSDILAVVRWTASIKEPASDVTLPVAITTLLAIFDTTQIEPQQQLVRLSDQGNNRRNASSFSPALEALFMDSKFITDLHSFITTKVNWKASHASDPNPVQPVVQLAWCLFLIQAFRYRPSLINETKIWENVIEDCIIDAIHASALDVCANGLLRFKKPEDPFEELGWTAGTREESSAAFAMADVDADFQDAAVGRIDTLVESLITNASSILRKVRHREEDILMATSLGRTSGTPSRRRLSSSTRGGEQVSNAPTEQRHDVEALFSLIATLYRDAPDAALKYWIEDDSAELVGSDSAHRHSRLSAFLRWASDCRVPSMTRSFFDMLGSLATGPQSATYAFEFLSQNGNGDGSGQLCSWSSLFDALSFYGTQRNSQDGPTEIPLEEVALLKSFLRLLRIVVSSSAMARAALYDNQRYRPVITLFNLIVQPVPIDLKAALLEGVTAFTKPAHKDEGAGMISLGVEIARRTWMTLENSQILSTVPQTDARGVIMKNQPSSGIVLELEQVEVPSKVYPTTTAFVALLVSLLGGPVGLQSTSDVSLAVSSLDTASSARTIPDNLGSPHRSPAEGISAYTRYVVDDVLLKAQMREYRNSGERWRVTERCLAYIERCLLGLNFDNFLKAPSSSQSAPQNSMQQLLTDPGFDLLSRLLGGGALLDAIFDLASVDLETLDDTAAASATFVTCVLQSLRILQRIFTLQAPLLEVVLPALLESSASLSTSRINSLRNIQPLDQYMLYKSRVVVCIAVLVNTVRSKAVALAAIRILTFLADSSTFNVVDIFKDVYRTKMNRLAGLIDASDETARVQDGFVRRLSGDSDFDDLPVAKDVSLLRPEDDVDEAIKSSILDLLLRNTQPSSQAPNIAHLLLGCDIRRKSEELDFDDIASDASASCLHVILAYCDKIALDHRGMEAEDDLPNLLVQTPSLAEKSYRLVRQLCLHDYTSKAVTAYLRSRRHFFLSHASLLPLRFAEVSDGANGTVTFSDGSTVSTASSTVTSTLQSQAWLLETLALELNSLVASNQAEQAIRLLASLYGGETDVVEDDSLLQNGSSQTLPRMLDVFYSLDFSWTDDVQLNPAPLSFFSNVSFDGCLRKQAAGSEIYDFEAVLQELQAVHNSLRNQGGLNNQQQLDAIRAETKMILENLVVENNRREIQHARHHTLQSWRNLLDITLTKAFSLLPSNGADSLLLDLLGSVIPPIGAEDTDAVVQEIFAGAAVLLMTELRQQGLLPKRSSQSQLFSTDRLLPILQATIRAIVQPGLSNTVRGNLYAVLLQYIHHSSQLSGAQSSTAKTITNSLSLTNVNENATDDSFSFDGASTVGGTKTLVRRTPLEAGNLSTLQGALEKLLPVLCLDAAAGHQVWQTVAFTLLDTLCAVAGEGSTGSKLAGALSKQGYLQAFVASIKEQEADLNDVLKPDPESLNALYVYEAKMSFLTRIASTREGAEKLLEAQALSRLASCSFIEERPKLGDVAMDFDSFLPPVIQRYHQLLLPTLQLALAIATGCGSHSTSAAKQVQSLLLDQREAMKAVLEVASVAPTLLVLQEAHLLVHLMRFSLPTLSDQEITAPLGFGGLHTSLLGLTSVVLAEQDWLATVQPSNDDEQIDAETVIPDVRKPTTVFDDKLGNLFEALQMSILEYHKATTKRPGSTIFRPVWLPTFQLDDGKSRSAITAPTMRGAFVYLLDTVDLLLGRLEDQRELIFKRENFEDIGIHELELYEDAMSADDAPQDGQSRRDRLARILEDLSAKLRAKLLSTLHSLELTLLLMWRHLGYYLEDRQTASYGSPDAKLLNGASGANGFKTQSLRSSIDLRTIKQNAQDAFSLVHERLQNLQLEKSFIGVDARSHEALLATLQRSMLDLLGEREA